MAGLIPAAPSSPQQRTILSTCHSSTVMYLDPVVNKTLEIGSEASNVGIGRRFGRKSKERNRMVQSVLGGLCNFKWPHTRPFVMAQIMIRVL